MKLKQSSGPLMHPTSVTAYLFYIPLLLFDNRGSIPMLGDPTKPMYSSKIDRILERGAVKIVHNQVPSFYGRLFLVENVTGVGGPFEVQDGDGYVCHGIQLKGRLYFLNSCDGRLISEPNPSKIETIPSSCVEQKHPPVQRFLLWPFFSVPCLHQRVCFSLEVGTSDQHSSTLVFR